MQNIITENVTSFAESINLVKSKMPFEKNTIA